MQMLMVWENGTEKNAVFEVPPNRRKKNFPLLKQSLPEINSIKSFLGFSDYSFW